jgi:pyruvate dehydrogenase E2 component (dihydrolipoamide acetyltransferase)
MLAVSDVAEVRVPDIGDFKDVAIIDILVKPGDVVKADDSLITIESDKAAMDVPAPVAGVVGDLRVKVGDRVSEGSVILTIASSAVRVERGHQEPPQQPQRAATAAITSMVELRVPDIGDFKDVPVIELLIKVGDSLAVDTPVIVIESDKASMDVPSVVAGVLQSIAVKVGDRVSQGSLLGIVAGVEAAVPLPPAPVTALVTTPVTTPPVSVGTVHAGPAVRRLAREFGVALAQVQGTAPHGRVTTEDLRTFVRHTLQGQVVAHPVAAASGSGLQLAPWPKVDFAKYGPTESKPLSRIKQISGSNLHRNWVLIPHVTNNEEADITELEAFRVRVNEEHSTSGVKLTMLVFLIKALVGALHKFPEFNASLDGDNLVFKQYYHIGFAADTPNGLVVPIVRDVDKKGLLAIAQETRDLAAKARDGKLTSLEIQGGTFTISSLGGIGGTTFTPIINAPEVAILGVSRSTMRPVWDGLQFMPRLMLPLSLSYDHRVIDGAAAARFNAYLASILTDMRRTML